jgi:putative sigma-54 modulation protein
MKERPYQLSEFVAARRRAVLPPWVSRPLKRSGGRASPIPAHVRETGVALSDDDRTDITRRLGMKLGKFAWSIERVTVRARDVNGPRGGLDQECTVKVVLSGLPSVVVKRRHAVLQAAIDEALHAVEQAVRRRVERRRKKPLHGLSQRQAALTERNE